MLTGTFHSLNRGDCAMQLATAQCLRERWPDARIAVHVPYPEDERATYADYETIACSRRRPVRALRTIFAACLWRASGGRTPLSQELRSYRDADLVVDLSGDGLTETFGWRCPVSHTIPLLLAHLMKTPFCLMAQTIGPFERLRPWFRWILRRARFVTTRDEETFIDLSNWNLHGTLELTADVAFLLQPAPESEAVSFLQSIGAYSPSRPLIGVTPSNLHNIRTADQNSSTDGPENVLASLAAAVDALRQETDCRILIIPHVYGPGKAYDDRRAANVLASMLTSECPPLVIGESLSASLLKALIGRCDIFLGMRMHSVIAATSQAIPTLAVAYSPKLLGLMERLALRRYTVPCVDASKEKLAAMARELWVAREAVRKEVTGKIRDDVLPAAHRNFDLLEEALIVNHGELRDNESS